MRQVVQILEAELNQYIKAGQVKITDGALTFSNSNNLQIKKFILDDGYEDPLVINFGSGLPTVSIGLDQFLDKKGSQATARKLGDLLRALLEARYKLEELALGGVTIHRITTKSGQKFESSLAYSGIPSWMPAFAVRRWGRRKVLANEREYFHNCR